MVWQLVVALVIQIIAYLLQPGADQSAGSTEDMDDPTAEAGRPIPVLFGTKTITGLNILWYGEKQRTKYKADGGGKK